MHEAVFSIHTIHASIIAEALISEDEEEQDRSTGFCQLIAENQIELIVKAQDLIALRASLNSWLRLIQVAAETSEIAKESVVMT